MADKRCGNCRWWDTDDDDDCDAKGRVLGWCVWELTCKLPSAWCCNDHPMPEDLGTDCPCHEYREPREEPEP